MFLREWYKELIGECDMLETVTFLGRSCTSSAAGRSLVKKIWMVYPIL